MPQVLEKSQLRFGGPDRERLFDTGEEPSLDELISSLSQSLAVRGNAACLVCGAMFVRTGGGPASASAECSSCGSRLE